MDHQRATVATRGRSVLITGLVAAAACGGDAGEIQVDAATARGEEWDDVSHGDGTPDPSAAFPTATRDLRIEITAADWQTLDAQMAMYCGAFGGGQAQCSGSSGVLDMVPSAAQAWIPVTLIADGHEWKHVGARLKGNSSLTRTWASGSYALPLRLTMDKFEDSEPSISDQRFYGFQKLSLSNNSGDTSGVRELVAGAVFADAGVPVSRSSPTYVTLVIDGAEVSSALYTLVEVPDDPLLNRSFEGDDDGALYKPESTLASFVESEFADDDLSDYAPVQELIAALTATTRTSDPAAWRSALEAEFDVDGFLTYLAVNTALLNWDAYGQLAHNYYLYDHDGVVRWIAWDLGLAMSSGGGAGGGGGPGGGPGGSSGLSSTSIWYEDTGADWPLIRYLLDDPVYCAAYADATTTLLLGPLDATVLADHVATFGDAVAAYGATALEFDLEARMATVTASLAERATRCP